MRLSRALRRALPVAIASATVVALLPAVPAAAAPTPAEHQVRLVVRTTTRAAGAGVLEAAQRYGGRPAGRVAALRAVAIEVPATAAGALTRRLADRPDVTSVDTARRRWLSEEPADPRFGEQRTYLDAVRATAAWSRSAKGSPDVRIGIVDSGADIAHPDLVGKVVGTYNAVTRSSDVRDQVGHGTGVASVAAAATNNGEGIAAAGYDSTLLVAKVADRTGRIFTDDLAAGVVWAVDNGADVVNLSLGGPSSDRLERDAVRYAQSRGVLVVAAAGNDGSNLKQFPASLPGVLGVGATSADGGTRAPFSSFGSWIDVGAPGRDLVVAKAGGGYETVDGTSFAAPIVSGEAALLAAYRPGRTGADLAAAIIGGANGTKLGFARGLVDFDASLTLLPPASTPVLTLPAGPVSGPLTVSASSSAASVRLELGDQVATVPTQSGTATATFETYGLSGTRQVTATDCSRITQCAESRATGSVEIANPAPTLTAPTEGADASADTLTASADAPADATVGFLVDGALRAVDSAAPFAATLSTETLADGRHTVGAVLCRRDHTSCDTSAAGQVTVAVDRLHPRVRSLTRSYLSPNRDGRGDTTTVRYLLESRQAVTLRVRTASGAIVLARRLGVQAAGRHEVRWDGRGRAGKALPDAAYTLEVSTRDPDGTQIGLASRPVTVDVTRPRAGRPTTTGRTVFPVRDGYRDTVDVRATVGRDARSAVLEVRTPAGRLVESRRAALGSGQVVVGWNGRTRAGRLLAPGRYVLRLLVEDHAGNRRRSAATRVAVSGQRLARRSGSLTVTARDTLEETFVDDCSMVFRHTEGRHRGWVGYFSSGTCSSGDAYAVGEHEVRLPRAVRYGTVRISAHGGRGDPKYRDSARLTYYDRYQNLSPFTVRLRARTDTYVGPRVRAERLLSDRRVLRWSTMTTGVAWYDVERYTVDYTFFVLR